MCFNVVAHLLVIEAVGIVNAAVYFGDANQLAPFGWKIFASEVPDISEALYDKGFAWKFWAEFESLGDERIGHQKFSCCKDAQASGLKSATDASLLLKFASRSGVGVDIDMSKVSLIGWFHPGHFSGTCADVRPWDIDCCPNWVLLCQLDCVSSGQLLYFSGRVFSRVDAYASLGTPIGKVDYRTFDGHEASQCLYFLNVDILGVACASLGGEFVSFMLAAIGGNGFQGSVILVSKKYLWWEECCIWPRFMPFYRN